MNASSIRFVVLVAMLGAATGAHAQLSPFGRQAPTLRLQQSDFAMLSDAARTLYTDDAAADGASNRWANPATGASGTVTLKGSFTAHRNNQAYRCRKVRYDINVKASTNARTYNVNWCKTPTQEWKVLS